MVDATEKESRVCCVWGCGSGEKGRSPLPASEHRDAIVKSI